MGIGLVFSSVLLIASNSNKSKGSNEAIEFNSGTADDESACFEHSILHNTIYRLFKVFLNREFRLHSLFSYTHVLTLFRPLQITSDFAISSPIPGICVCRCRVDVDTNKLQLEVLYSGIHSRSFPPPFEF